MANAKSPEKAGDGEDVRRTAEELADGLVKMVEASREVNLGFLAYLLGMALKEARSLSTEDDQDRG